MPRQYSALAYESLGEAATDPGAAVYHRSDADPGSDPHGEQAPLLVAITCGGLRVTGRSDPIRPDRRVLLSSDPYWYPTILEWHLRRLDEIGKDKKIVVVLLTTPDTHADVCAEWWRIDSIVSLKNVQVSVVRQRLVGARGGITDGGLGLAPKGSGYALTTLAHTAPWNSYDRCLVVPFNNLGDIYGDETWKRFDELPAGCTLATETFRYAVTGSSRWYDYMAPMSYVGMWEPKKPVYEPRKILIKDSYPRAAECRPVEGARRWSTGTWFVRLSELAKHAKPKRLEPRLDRRSDRFDIDELTCTFSWHEFELRSTELRNPFVEARFQVIRNEDDAENSKIHAERLGVLKERVSKVSPGRGVFEWDRRSPLVLTPTTKVAPWGREQWYGGHDRRPATVSDTRGEVHTLPAVLSSDPAQPQVMVKYLDCRGRLSVQLHPDEKAIAALNALGGPEFSPRLKDQRYKDERFLVLREASTGEPQLICGLSREGLAEVAEPLRQSIEDTWQALEDLKKGSSLNDPISLTGELREALTASLLRSQLVSDITGLVLRDGKADQLKGHLLARISPDKIHSSTKNIAAALAHHFAQRREGNPSGLEYLTAAIGVFEIIRRLAADLRRAAKGASEFSYDRDGAEQLFRLEELPTTEEGVDRNPLRRLFHFLRAVGTGDGESGSTKLDVILRNSWGTVDAGMLHSWLGGGSFLIEISELSDNTFRILDFGRELRDGTKREMHLVEAMFAIRDRSIMSEDAVQSNFWPAVGPNAVTDIHRSTAEVRVWSNRSAWERLWPGSEPENDLTESEDDWPWTLVLNPDGPYELRLASKSGAITTGYWPVADRAAVYLPAVDGHRWQVRPAVPSHRLVAVGGLKVAKDGDPASRDGGSHTLVFSIGESKHEVGLADQHDLTPLHSVETLSLPAEVRQSWTKTCSHLVKSVQGDNPSRCSRCILIWPGYYDPESDTWTSSRYRRVKTPERLLKAILKDCLPESRISRIDVLPDAAASAAGERQHPEGGLRPTIDPRRNGLGVVVNAGSGLCVGLSPDIADKPEAWWKDKRLSALSAVGRWLYVNVDSGVIEVRPDQHDRRHESLSAAIMESIVKCPSDSLKGVDGRKCWLRASRYFSWSGLTAQWLLLLDAHGVATEFGRPFHRFPRTSSTAESIRELGDNIKESREPRIALAAITSGAVRDGKEADLTRRFIRRVAFQLATVLNKVAATVPILYADGPPPGAVDEWFRPVVLAGWVGHHFGRVSLAGGEVEDLFLHTLHQTLGGEDTLVARSIIGTAWHREYRGAQLWLRRGRQRVDR